MVFSFNHLSLSHYKHKKDNTMFDNQIEIEATDDIEELSIELNIEELEQRLEMANPACTRCCVGG
jgi:hypothetical protein